jgi:outer membrane protein OmpA-like peptidoglycan-associated protein
MKKVFILLIGLFLALTFGCAPGTHFGVPDKAGMVPPDFDQTADAIAKAEKSAGAAYCPDKIAKAKELAKKGVETYWACRTAEGLAMLADARKLAKEAESCQPLAKPAPSAPPAAAPPPAPAAPAAKHASLKWVYFDFNKATITPKATAILDETVKSMKENPAAKLELSGHTDAKGTDAYNQKLSEQRTNAVQQYLVSKGVPASRIKVMSFGESQPVSDNKTDQGRASNRRVEVKIIP